VLDLTVSGTIGETLTIESLTDRTGVTGGNGYATTAINSIVADAVPEPSEWALLLCGIGLFAVVQRNVRKNA
jgi:hypothetical protein